ncbi:MAG TPA: M20/M25/M40 family metallo-hydrolase [Solirubrobacteraceae bacterium]|nr:M20/M25/M40 family metallo-hydrolase [Solirubrobacteraceae bacterium]
MDPWVQAAAADIGRHAERELEALVAVSSPSGDVHGAEECAALCAALAPDTATIERPPCSSPGHAPDLVASLHGTGAARIMLLGHVDTVVAHEAHRPLEHREGRLVGSGAVDMKGGDVLALGALRALAGRPERYAEVALLLVCDEEWRTGPMHHVERFAGYDACLCFEAGELGADGAEGVVVQRKAAATLHVHARGRSAHSGSAPDRGRNALLALAAAAQAVAARHDPHGPHHLTAVPTILRTGDAFNVVPGSGELFCDCRADDLAAVESVLAAIPGEVGGVRLEPETVRRWPAMARNPAVEPVLERASAALGRTVAGASRGGASDASHMAASIPVTIDGLGPRGGKAHNPGEFVLAESLHSRAEVALAVIDAVLD